VPNGCQNAPSGIRTASRGLGSHMPNHGATRARALRCKKQKSARERARSARELSFDLKERARARARARVPFVEECGGT